MKYFLFSAFLLITSVTFAQTDSSAYSLQRNKINQLLAERSSRFGQYDASLTRRTGIFGLKTKRDMQASNDILTQIVLNDNNIFSELKVLLDYKDYEKKEVETKAEVVEGRVDRYQQTITNLQKQNDLLISENEKLDKRNSRLVLYITWLIIIALVAIFWNKLKKLRIADKQIPKD